MSELCSCTVERYQGDDRSNLISANRIVVMMKNWAAKRHSRGASKVRCERLAQIPGATLWQETRKSGTMLLQMYLIRSAWCRRSNHMRIQNLVEQLADVRFLFLQYCAFLFAPTATVRTVHVCGLQIKNGWQLLKAGLSCPVIYIPTNSFYCPSKKTDVCNQRIS